MLIVMQKKHDRINETRERLNAGWLSMFQNVGGRLFRVLGPYNDNTHTHTPKHIHTYMSE